VLAVLLSVTRECTLLPGTYLQDIRKRKQSPLPRLYAAVVLQGRRITAAEGGAVDALEPFVAVLAHHESVVFLVNVWARLHAEGEVAGRDVVTVEVVERGGADVFVHLSFDLCGT
jgi:hypothetical protein